MKGIVFIICFLLLFPIIGFTACVDDGDGTWTSTPDRASVASCISQASAEDTIDVSAGDFTWTSGITITQGVYLIGAGIGNTNITSGTSSYLIYYNPSSENQASNYNFRVSGFSFLLGGAASYNHAIKVDNDEETPTQSNIRIDNNRFAGYSSSGTHNGAILNHGCWGVIDNNIFDDITYPARVGWGAGDGAWEWSTYTEITYGSDDFMFIEDNTFTDLGGTLSDGDAGGRYVFRYNDITWVSGLTVAYNSFDLHAYRTGIHAAMGGEIYGNEIDGNDTRKMIAKHRGGKLLVFFNSSTGVSHYMSISNYNSESSCPSDPDELMSDSYYFNNRANYTGTLENAYTGANNCNDADEDEEWFRSATGYPGSSITFDGTSGVGCGSALPNGGDASGYLEGVGFWVTSQGNCNNLTGYVGKEATEIVGTLWKVESEVWVEFYTPYSEYPHPLRGESSGRTIQGVTIGMN